MALNGGHIFRCVGGQILVAAHHHLANHPGQAHALAVFRAEDAGHAIGLQLTDFRRNNDATATTKHLNVGAAARFQQVHHVLEILDVPPLVRTDGDALRILLQRRRHDFIHAAVVTQVNHLGAHALQNAAHDVDRRIMAVKQAGGRDKAHLVHGSILAKRLEFSGQVGHGVVSGGQWGNESASESHWLT